MVYKGPWEHCIQNGNHNDEMTHCNPDYLGAFAYKGALSTDPESDNTCTTLEVVI